MIIMCMLMTAERLATLGNTEYCTNPSKEPDVKPRDLEAALFVLLLSKQVTVIEFANGVFFLEHGYPIAALSST